MSMTEQEVVDYLARHGFKLDPTLTAKTPRNPATAERALLAEVRRLAKALAFQAYHTHDSRKSDAGFPDLCLVRTATPTTSGRLIFAELKIATGKLTQEQHCWLEVLRQSIPGVEVYVWRPTDLHDIARILARKEP